MAVRILKRAGLAFLIVLLLLAAGVAGLFAWLRTPSGLQWLKAQIESSLSTPEQPVTVGVLSGTFPADLSISDLRFADQKGMWLSVDQVRLRWHPRDLLGWYVNVEALEAETVHLNRLPEGQEEQAAPDDRVLPEWPRLPMGVSVDRLTVRQFILGQEVAGPAAATFSIKGKARFAQDSGLASLDLGISRTDGPAGELAASVGYMPAANTLDIDIRMDEAANGVLSTLLALPGAPPVAIHLTGHGLLQDWKAALRVQAGDVLSAKGAVRLQQAEDAYSFTLDADAELAALFEAPVSGLLGKHTTLKAQGKIVPEETITLDTAILNTASGTAQLSGTLDLEDDRIDLRYFVEAGADSALHELADTAWTKARLEGTAAGKAAFPAVAARMTLDNPVLRGIGAETLTANMALMAGKDGPAKSVPFTLNATVHSLSGLPPVAAGVIGTEASFQANGSLRALENALVFDQAILRTAAAQLTAKGRAEDGGQAVNGQITLMAPDLGVLNAATGASLSGKLEAQAEVSYAGTVDSLQAHISGEGTGLHTGIPSIDALVGDHLSVTGRALPLAGQGLRIDDMRIETATLTSALNAMLLGGQLKADWVLDVPKLARLETLAGQPLEGALHVKGQADGPLDSLTLTAKAAAPGMAVAGVAVGEAALDIHVAGLPKAPAGTVRAEARYGDHPVMLAADIDSDETRYLVDRLNAAFGRNRASGHLSIDKATSLIAGKLEGSLEELSAFDRMLGQPLGGMAAFTLELMPANDQTARLDLQGQNLAIGENTLASAHLNASITDVFANPQLKAQLDARDVRASGATLDTVTATAAGTSADTTFTLDANGRAGEAFRVQVSGAQRTDQKTRAITLNGLEATYAQEQIRLAKPATIILSPEDVHADADLILGDGYLALDLTHGGQQINGTLDARRIPLRLARLADPTLELTGTADMTASISGALPTPQGELKLMITDLRLPESTDAGISAVNGNAIARLRDGRVSAEAMLATESKRLSLRATGETSLLIVPETGMPTIPGDSPLTAAVSGQVDMAIADDILAVRGDRMTGAAEIDLRAMGTVAEPDIAGTVTVSNGRYESQAAGVAVTDINARLAGTGTSLTIQDFSGKTPGGGTLSLEGNINLNPVADEQIALRFTAQNARVVQTDLATATISAEIGLAGSFADSLASGRVKVEQAEIRVPERLPPNVVKLDVVEINGANANVPAPARKPARASTATMPSAGGQIVRLDIKVEAPNQVFVRGRGLNVELAGKLDILGTVDAPRIEGALNLVKGDFAFLGKQLQFQRGTITFVGDGSLEPILDLTATAEAGDVDVDVHVTGRVSAPSIAFSSSSGLPQDELLARLLFGKQLTQLSALEAVQLAQSAAELAGFGGGAGILDTIRTGLGIDRLEITGGEEGEGVEGASVTAGRYLSDQVYVGVEQGLNDSRVTVELDVTRNIQLEADVGIQTAPSVGVQFEWEY